MRKITFVCAALLSCVVSLVASAGDRITQAEIAQSRLVSTLAPTKIFAELVDAGDYYNHPSGRQIKLFRKKDVYAVRTVAGRNILQTTRAIQNATGMDLSVQGRQLGDGLHVVKLEHPKIKSSEAKQSSRVFARSGHLTRARDTTNLPSQLTAPSSHFREVKPVFANSRGRGDMVLLPKLTVKLKAGDNDKVRIVRIAKKSGLKVESKLKVGGSVYSLLIEQENISPSDQFRLVRQIASDLDVLWAEPQFISRPRKNVFDPPGALYSQQWHLKNTGERGSLCDSDCDANNAWGIDSDGIGGADQGVGAVSGDGMVIAVLDDGVQLDHPDLNIWVNPGETNINDGIDNDGNGFIDDWRGWDFVDDPNTSLKNSDNVGAPQCIGGDDGIPGPDNNPSPQPTVDCYTAAGDPVLQDDHGTAVAGLAAADGTTSEGVVGTAFRATILPIRVISEFDNSVASFCTTIAEAMAYAGRYADVINNSWSMDDTCIALEDTIADITAGQVLDGGNASSASMFKRPNLGSPVIFSSGNAASGWIKVTVPVSAGVHAFEWRFLRSAFPGIFDSSNTNYDFEEDDTAWLDHIVWPNDEVESFESGLGAFTSDIVLNQCNADCTEFIFAPRPTWEIETNLEHVLDGTQSAKINAAGSDCGNVYLHTLRETVSGEISFWVWVSTNMEDISDKFEFLVDGEEVISFGDVSGFVDNAVDYPANLVTTIAVGASDSGNLIDDAGANQGNAQRRAREKRLWYSQFGAELDLLAPSDNQHLGITTTDRTGESDGYNRGNPTDYSDSNYTNNFGGTSASAPIVAGIAAAIIAIDTDATAEEVRNFLNNGADKIGGPNVVYDNGGVGRNDFYGHGRVNMHNSVRLASGQPVTDPTGVCSSPELFDYTSNNDRMRGQLTPFAPFCPAIGPVPQADELCVPIITSNSKVAMICL